MTKEESAQLAEDIGNIVADILLQLNNHNIKPTFVEQFYLGLLVRERLILRDAAVILTNNDEKQITSAFILFRVLLDDFIRLFSVYSSTDMEEEIIKIQADALNHRLKNIQFGVDINNDFFNGQHSSLFTQQKLDDEKQKLLSNPEFDKFFKDKANYKFKTLPAIAEIFKLLKNDVKTNANVHSYIVYKFLTQYVHYSNIAFYLDNDKEVRKVEIGQLEEILLYSYKMLLMQFEFLNRTYSLTWNDSKITDFFRAKTIYV